MAELPLMVLLTRKTVAWDSTEMPPPLACVENNKNAEFPWSVLFRTVTEPEEMSMPPPKYALLPARVQLSRVRVLMVDAIPPPAPFDPLFAVMTQLLIIM